MSAKGHQQKRCSYRSAGKRPNHGAGTISGATPAATAGRNPEGGLSKQCTREVLSGEERHVAPAVIGTRPDSSPEPGALPGQTADTFKPGMGTKAWIDPNGRCHRVAQDQHHMQWAAEFLGMRNHGPGAYDTLMRRGWVSVAVGTVIYAYREVQVGHGRWEDRTIEQHGAAWEALKEISIYSGKEVLNSFGTVIFNPKSV